MLAMREAFAHATLGDRRATHTAISEAHSHFERIHEDDPDPAWVTYFDKPKLIVDGQIAEVDGPLVVRAGRHVQEGSEASEASTVIAPVKRWTMASTQ